MHRAISVTLLSLAACQPDGGDGHSYERTEFHRKQVIVDVVEYSSESALQKAAEIAGVKQHNIELKAWGKVHPTEPRCEIHIVDPSKNHSRVWPGHELLHCLRGRWHK